MGTGTAAGTTGCPKVLNVTLAGASSSSWATDAIVKIAAAIKTDSDGYKITLEMSGNVLNTGTAGGEWMGGCLAVGTTNPIVCFWGKTLQTDNTSGVAATLQYVGLVPTYTATKNYTTAAVLGTTTAITAAKWNMVMAGNNCSAATMTINGTGISTATCQAATFAHTNNTGKTSSSWFQPKETSTKVYTTLTRFSAKENATWTGMANTSKKHTAGCTAKALTGASALVAGAAVAFGAAALAF